MGAARWDDAKELRAVKLYQTGMSVRAVAREMRACVRKVHTVLTNHGVVRKKSDMYRGSGNPAWKGGRTVVKGYVLIYAPDHPNADYKSRVPEHRLVMEAALGRYLASEEVVHHRGDDKTDNRLENLELFESNAAHLKSELRGRVPNWSEAGKRKIMRTIRRTARRRAAGEFG